MTTTYQHTVFLVVAMGEPTTGDEGDLATDEDVAALRNAISERVAGIVVHVVTDATLCGRIRAHLTARLSNPRCPMCDGTGCDHCSPARCTCEWADDEGDLEVGPSPYLVEADVNCPIHGEVGRFLEGLRGRRAADPPCDGYGD